MSLLLSLPLAMLLCPTGPAGDPPSPPRDRPNVVILYADDMGWGDLGAQNPASKIPTPRLDRLAAQGMRFSDAHSSSGICTPSRYALLTGRYHWRAFHGIVQAFGPSVLEPERLTLPEMMKAAGYRTACIGKWHLGWDWSAIRKPDATEIVLGGKKRGYTCEAFDWSKPIPDGPLAHGFEHYFGDDVPNFPPYTWIEDQRVLIAPTKAYAPDPRPAEGAPEGRPGPMAEGWKQDQVMPRLTEAAVAWIAAQRGRDEPFFLYFPWTSPHAPIVPAREYQGATEAGGYGDFVRQSDATAGRVLDALEEHGFGANTIVIFTSDNGPERYAFERVRRHDHDSAGGLRGLKRDVWEGGHRVPMIVRWPGVVEAGAVSDALVGQIDLMASLAAVLAFELPDDAAEDSQNQLPVLRGEVERLRRELVHNTFEGTFGLRRDNWVLIDAPTGTHSKVPQWYAELSGYHEGQQPAQLHDLATDRGQRRNLYEQHPAKVAELRARLARLRQQGHSAPRLDE